MPLISVGASWLPVFLWAGFIFYLSNIPALRTDLGIWDLILRKIAHVTEFAILTGLLHRAWRRTWPASIPWKRIIGTGICAFLYAVSDEIHQSYVPFRGSSIFDVMIDSIGIVLCLGILWRME